MGYFNNEKRKQEEFDTLYEQSVRVAMANRAKSQGGVGGGSIIHQKSKDSTLIANIISIYLENEGLAILIRCNYIGLDKNNYPMYTYTIIDGIFSIAINYDNDHSQWKITFFGGGGEELGKLYSDSLISSEWVPEGKSFMSVTHTESGTPTSTYWCSSTTDFGYGPIISNLMPAWDEEHTVENPNVWIGAVVTYGWLDDGQFRGWFIDLDGISEVFIEGGSQDVLPSSVETGGVTITATQGSCEL